MFLSAVWALILMAPICRASDVIGLKEENLIHMLDGLGFSSTFKAKCHFWVNYIFYFSDDIIRQHAFLSYSSVSNSDTSVNAS